MKYLAYGLMFLSVAILAQSFSIAKRDTRDDLLKEVKVLKDLAAKEMDKLKAEGKGELAKGLDKAEKVVVDIESQLLKLNPTTDVGKALLAGLESTLKSAETKLKDEIKKLSGSYFDDDLKDTLLVEAERLKKMATDEIEKLKSQGKTVLASGLEKAAKVVLDLEAQLKALNPNTEVGKAVLSALQGLIKKAETMLNDEIKKLSGSYFADELKDTLLVEAEKLKKIATDEIEKLKSQGKTLIAAELEKAEKVVLDVEAQVKVLDPKTEIGKAALAALEGLLKKAETTLLDEIKKLSGSYFADDLKDTLLVEAEKLKKMTADEIAKLKSQGKTFIAAELEKGEKVVLDLETQLKALDPKTEVGKAALAVLESLLKKAETTLMDEIKKLSGTYFADDVKETLLVETEKLKKLAADEIEKLKSQGKTFIAAELEKAEKVVLDLETQLKALDPKTEVGKAALVVLEGLLKKAETTLMDEIKKLSGTYFADDIKDQLLIEGEKLKKLAQEEMEKLKKEGKTELAAGLEKVVKVVVDVETQLKALNPTTEVGKTLLISLEAVLKKAEDTLTAEIKKLSGSF